MSQSRHAGGRPGYPVSASVCPAVAHSSSRRSSPFSPSPDQPCRPPKPGSLDQIRQGLTRAVASGQLDQPTADRLRGDRRAGRHRAAVDPAASRPDARARCSTDIAGQTSSYTPQYALTLFSMLEFNAEELAAHPLPPSGTDTYGDDGVLYRFVTGHGFEFHPLGDFGALNTLILAGKTDQAKELADALVARGVPRRTGGCVWSYPFPFGERQAAVALGDGAGRRRAGARPHGPGRGRPGSADRRRPGVRRDPRPARPRAAAGTVDQALQLRRVAGAERPAPDA